MIGIVSINSITFLPAQSPDRFIPAELSRWGRFCERIRYHVRNRCINTRSEEGVNGSDLPNFRRVRSDRQAGVSVSISGKPTRDGERRLWDMGVRTRVILRKEDRLPHRRDKLSPSFNIVYLALGDRRTPSVEVLEKLIDLIMEYGNINDECRNGVGRSTMVQGGVEIKMGKPAAQFVSEADRRGERLSLPIPMTNLKFKMIFSLNLSQRERLYEYEKRVRANHPHETKENYRENIVYEKVFRFNLILRLERERKFLPDASAAAAEVA